MFMIILFAENMLHYCVTCISIQTQGSTKTYTHRSPDNTMTLTILLASEIPGMLSQWIEKVVIWAFQLHTVAKYDSAYLKLTTTLPNLWPDTSPEADMMAHNESVIERHEAIMETSLLEALVTASAWQQTTMSGCVRWCHCSDVISDVKASRKITGNSFTSQDAIALEQRFSFTFCLTVVTKNSTPVIFIPLHFEFNQTVPVTSESHYADAGNRA